jgi:hypothetical protein
MRGVHASQGAILLFYDEELALAHAENIPASGLAERLAAILPANPASGMLRTGDPALPFGLPLITPVGATIGWLVLAPHPDESPYCKDDRRALEELAIPLARALSVAIERAHRDAEREAERRTLTARLAQLEQSLAQVVTPRREAGTA